MELPNLSSFFKDLDKAVSNNQAPVKTNRSKSAPNPSPFQITQLGVTGFFSVKESTQSNNPLYLSTLHSPIIYNQDLISDQVASSVLHSEEEMNNLWPRSSKIWSRSLDSRTLYSGLETSKPETTIHVDFDDSTGKVTGFEEVEVKEKGGDPTQSMSLLRDPAPIDDFVRGSNEYFPFLPGGVSKVKNTTTESKSCYEDEESLFNFAPEKLLKAVPGFKETVSFKSGVPKLMIDGKEQSKGSDVDEDVLKKYGKLRGKDYYKVAYEERVQEGQSRMARKDELAKLIEKSEYLNLGSDEEVEYEIVEEIEYVEEDDDGTEDGETRIEIIEEIVEIVEEDDDDADGSGGKKEDEDKANEDTKKKEEKEKILDELLDDNFWKVESMKMKEKTGEVWGVLERRDMYDFYDLVPEMAIEYPFELDTFQKEAIYHLERGECVFVAAHTSAGKTVVAEYAIALAMKHMTRVVYTSPIKALSNQKFRDFKEIFSDVGLITGDVSVNPEATCLVLTTEILRSMLYKGADLVRDIEWVIFDEVHYINDAERGVVWEEVIIMLPDHVGLIFLSATVPNTFEFADWVGRTKRKKVFVVSTNKRPVPLEHFLYANEELYKIVDKAGTFSSTGYRTAVRSFSDKKKNNDKKPTTAASKAKSDFGSYTKLVRSLEKRNLLPTVIFVFSKKRCTDLAYSLSSIDLNTAKEKGEIHVFIESSLARLKGSDKLLPQVLAIKDLLKRGIGLHHGGLLPIIKEIVEILFSKGLVKVLFATETFAMGVNMPARTVIFNEISKHDGNQKRELLSSEYTQMSGRAGRRGIDNVGVVIILAWNDVPESGTLQKMITGQATKLLSQFRLTYNMILNLLRMSGQFKVEDMIKRSFSESSNQRSINDQQKRLKKGEKLIKDLEDIACLVQPSANPAPIYNYYATSRKLNKINDDMQQFIFSSNHASQFLNCGRVIVVNIGEKKNCQGILLRPARESVVTSSNTYFSNNPVTASAQPPQKYTVMVLTGKPSSNVKDLYSIHTVPLSDIKSLCKEKIKANDLFIIDREDLSFIQTVVNDLEKVFIEHLPHNPPSLDPIKDLKIKDIDFNLMYKDYVQVSKELEKLPCHTCPHLKDQYQKADKEHQVTEHVEALKFMLSDDSLHLKPEFESRISVLKKLNYIDQDRIVQLKGKVAREVSTCEELIATELVLENVLTPLDAAETAALISCLVFQEKATEKPEIPTTGLKAGLNTLNQIATSLANVQIDCGLPTTPEDYIKDHINDGLMGVVYAWAKNMSFADICALTDVPEGSIVRTIVRLAETCRDFKSAARIIGDPGLAKKMEESIQLIKRDIVFAASLYVG
eukprot:TRINITY_DN6765_c0_g1_i1.p1 TRINITY_DN6765_c0_g1~~TRINITY_DN6765_c0_g1_i1.p1  ORF type:complete len:1333 (-),score=325.04 TRINITY_DN6765_c0_g1_i1:37-4035(-)